MKKRPRIVLIPTISLPVSKASIYIPLGLLAIKSFIKEYAEVVISDLSILMKKGVLKADETFYQQAACYLLELKADLYAFSTKSGSLVQTIAVAEQLKAIKQDALVALGGPQATACDEVILDMYNIDFIIRGEGEIPFLNIAKALSENRSLRDILSLSFREFKNKDEKRIGNMNELPMPAYEEYAEFYEHYLNNKPEFDIQSYVPIDSARGCPSNCKFCYSPTMWKRKCGFKSPERLVEEVRYLHDRFGVDSFFFTEDNFTVSYHRIKQFCELLLQEKFHIEWNCYSRIDTINKELIHLMKKAGCRQIYYGVESGSPKILKNLHKDYSVKQALNIIRFTIEEGIFVTASFIIGFPEEDASDIAVTLNAFLDTIVLGAISKLHLLGVEYGTVLYNEVENRMKFCPSVKTDILEKEYLITRKMLSQISDNKKLFSYFYTYEQGIFVENWIKIFRVEYNYSLFQRSLSAIRKSDGNENFLLEHLKKMINVNIKYPVGDSLEEKVLFFADVLIHCLTEKKRYDITKIVKEDFNNWKEGNIQIKRISKTL